MNAPGEEATVDGNALPSSGRRSRWPRRCRRLGRVLLASTGVLAAVVAVLLFVVWVWWQRAPGDDQRSRGLNALWAAHTWVGDEHSDDEYRGFAGLLTRNQVSDLFVHAGPLEGDGSVSADRLDHAAEFLTAMRQYAPEMRVQAYLGQIEERGGGPLDLDRPDVRDRIVATADGLLALGFQGIHYDIEPVFPGDDSFLDLLQRTHERTEARGAVLSVAVEQLEPAPGAQRLVSLFSRDYHDPTPGFLRQVAARVDQVAIMTYDTGLPAGWLFGSYMAWQTQRVVEAIGGDVTVFMGVPTYEEGAFLRFHRRAENISSGVRGVRKGLDRLDRDHTHNVGIAIFAEWTTDEDEWRSYAQSWLGE